MILRRALALPALAAAALGGPVAGAGAMDIMSGERAASTLAAMHHAAPTPSAGNAMVRVGTPEHPLIADGPGGPLWSASHMVAVGSSSHGTFAQITVARGIAKEAALRSAAFSRSSNPDPVSVREMMTTSQATETLSKACQRLIKRKTSQVSKKDRRRRSACLKLRTAMVAASKMSPPTTTPSSSTSAPSPVPGVTSPVPGVTAPGPSVPGPVATTPTATRPVVAAPVPTTPVAASPRVSALTATAEDFDVPFTLSRGTVPAGAVAFGLENHDRQEHNLSIAPSDAGGNITGPVKQIVVAEAGANVYATSTMSLAAGTYQLICTVEGHGRMAVQITVT